MIPKTDIYGEDIERFVVCAANRFGDVLVLGARHFDMTMHNMIAKIEQPYLPSSPSKWEQGFIDQFGVFMDRKEALQVATSAGQINSRRKKTFPEDKLFSEDLY